MLRGLPAGRASINSVSAARNRSSAGDMIVSIRAGIAAGFVKACAVPRGTSANAPGLMTTSWPPKRMMSSPSRR